MKIIYTVTLLPGEIFCKIFFHGSAGFPHVPVSIIRRLKPISLMFDIRCMVDIFAYISGRTIN